MHSLKSLTVVLLSVAVSALPTTLVYTEEVSAPVAIQALPTTENGLSGACKAVTLIFARGSMYFLTPEASCSHLC